MFQKNNEIKQEGGKERIQKMDQTQEGGERKSQKSSCASTLMRQGPD